MFNVVVLTEERTLSVEPGCPSESDVAGPALAGINTGGDMIVILRKIYIKNYIYRVFI